jgi:hypothetical protein
MLVTYVMTMTLLSGRNADWLDLSLNYAAEVMKCAALISIFPNFLHPCVASS